VRVAIVIHEYPPVGGGASTAAQQTARALGSQGHEVLVVTSAARGEARSSIDGAVRVRRLPALRLRTLAPSHTELLSFCASAGLLLSGELRRFGADGILAYFAVPAGIFAVRAGRRLEIPVVVSLRGSDVPGFPGGRLEGAFGVVARPALRRALSGAAAVAPNSEVLRGLALAFMPEVAGKTTVVPNGIDEASIADEPASSGSRTLELVQVGQLIERKRVDLAIEAMRALERAGVPARLTVIGDGPLRGALEAQAAELGVGGRVWFTGHLARAEIPGILRASDVFVMTSQGEGMSNAILEAMAAGLPVVATRNGSEDVVEQAGAGIVIEPGDAAALAARLRELAAAPDLRRRLALAGLSWARAHTWAATARAFVALLTAGA
jgi:glycogen synthase